MNGNFKLTNEEIKKAIKKSEEILTNGFPNTAVSLSLSAFMAINDQDWSSLHTKIYKFLSEEYADSDRKRYYKLLNLVQNSNTPNYSAMEAILILDIVKDQYIKLMNNI